MKVIEQVGARVTITVRDRWNSARKTADENAKNRRDDAEELRRLAMQHLHGYDQCGAVEAEFDYESKCSFCGSEWTEDSQTYNGGCCDKDEESNPKRQPAKGEGERQ